MQYSDNNLSEADEALILDAVDHFLERDVRPYAHDLEAADEYPKAIAEKLV
jgi:hypothetical protein